METQLLELVVRHGIHNWNDCFHAKHETKEEGEEDHDTINLTCLTWDSGDSSRWGDLSKENEDCQIRQ